MYFVVFFQAEDGIRDLVRSRGLGDVYKRQDILDLAKVDSGKMIFEKTPFKLAFSISAMLHLFEAKIHEKNLKLIVNYDRNIPEVLIGDPVRLHQIILNLVGNAVKFTGKGFITVGVHLLEADDTSVRVLFSVEDTGIGIAENKISSIFENFQQASSDTSRLYGGTGLGLAIVKQLVEHQGGAIQVQSSEGKGSLFSFDLSFQKTDGSAVTELGIEELDTEISALNAVSYTHLRAHETVLDLVCRLLLEKKKLINISEHTKPT